MCVPNTVKGNASDWVERHSIGLLFWAKLSAAMPGYIRIEKGAHSVVGALGLMQIEQLRK